ncbi:MAG TPA: oligosaccharide flippase family protein [Candidatus Acidoferrales bacterium]|nr:oligosaccharide flippase family protein [Candidatus Acidoferrales bacterium]
MLDANVPGNSPKKIMGNTFWYALDASAATIVMLIASVPVARAMGPSVVGRYVYLLFLTGTAQRLANFGIPATCRKYMAEYLGRGEYGVAHELFRVTFRYQITISGIITALGLCLAAGSEPGYRLIAFLIVLSMWPAMTSYIPAEANVAAEDLRANLPGSIAYMVTYSGLVLVTLALHWGLVGLATATLTSRLMEAGVRYAGARRRLRNHRTVALPGQLRKRMLNFSSHNLVLLALGLIVWDRSEVLFLKQFASVKQVAFYSLAFSIANQLMMLPRALSNSIGITMLAQYGRDPMRLGALLRNATRYVSVLAIPLFLGTAAISRPLIRATYGIDYLAVAPILYIMCISSIPRAFQMHLENLLQAIEKQGFMVKWLAVTAAVNLSLDAVLIPKHGAIGAAIANGLAQTTGVAGLFLKAGGADAIRSQTRYLGALCLSGAAMLGAVLAVVHALPPWPGLFAGVGVGIGAFWLGLRTTLSLEAEDCVRLRQWTNSFPTPVRRLAVLLTPQHGPVSKPGHAVSATGPNQ